MTNDDDIVWADDDGARLVPLYALTKGRTRPAYQHLDVATLVKAAPTANTGALEPEHQRILQLCAQWQAIAEISAHLKVPVAIAKIQLSDLIDLGAVVVSDPSSNSAVSMDAARLQQVLDGLLRMQ